MTTRTRTSVLAFLAGITLAAAFSGVANASGGAPRPIQARPDYVPTHVLVGFKAGTMGLRRPLERSVGATALRTVGARTHVLQVPRGRVLSTIAALKRSPLVAYAEPDLVVHADATTPNDTFFSELWAMQNTGQSVNGTTGVAGADIHATQAWSLGTGSSSVVVGVVDTGIDYTHPDLAANVWSNSGILGCAAGTHGYNAITGTCDPLDDNSHGTHVSGTIGALGNNGVGVTGINWTTSIMGLKFLDSTGSGSISGAISAIDFAVAAKNAGVNVVALNNSWGCSSSIQSGCFSQALLDEINKAGAAGILFVAAAGNNGRDLGGYWTYPCSFAAATEICVAASTQSDTLASFSNYGSTYVNLAAPGTNILSTVPGGYAIYNGTSMATPHVTGSLALLASDCPALTPAQRRSTILSSVDPVAAFSGLTSSGGRLDVFNAVKTCAAPPPPPTPDFSLSASPSTQTVTAGGSAPYTVTITRANGFADPVTLSVSGLPAGATATFSPNPASTSSTLTIATSASTPAGSSTITIRGQNPSASLTHTAAVTLVVQVPDYTLTISPAGQLVRRGQSATYTVTVNPLRGFSEAVTLSVSGLPANSTASWNPSSTSSSSVLTVVTNGATQRGTFTFTVRGQSASGIVRTVQATLSVRR